MSESLAVKYRPKTFEDVCSQQSIIKILQRQVELKQFKNAYLFAGGSGCGKTTCARIFANMINSGIGEPMEIDGASNNGVDNVKQLVKTASERSLTGKYKIIIMDECHALTSQAWQAFLKCIEEPPEYTIFIFCTTDPQKIPATILNRVMRFNFTKISSDIIQSRLNYICQSEGFTNYTTSTDYISRICHGGMRDAISLLEKASEYNTDLTMENVLVGLGNYSYDVFFKLINSIIDGDEKNVLYIVNDFYNQGNDLRLMVEQFLSFCLDLNKYLLFNDCKMTSIPSTMEQSIKNSVNFDDAKRLYGYYINKLLETKNMLKTDTDVKTTLEVKLLEMTRLQ